MKRLWGVFLILLLLTSCGNNEEKDAKNKGSGDEGVKTTEESEESLVIGFGPLQEVDDFIMDDNIFDPLYFEHWYTVEDDPLEWSMDRDIERVLKSPQGGLYYFSSSYGYTEPGLTYEIFTFDEQDKVNIAGKIFSPTNKVLVEEDEIYDVKEVLFNGVLFSKYQYHENRDGENSTISVTIESSDIGSILAGKKGNIQSNIVLNKTIKFNDDDSGEIDNRNDFGSLVNTSEGPVYVYQQNPDQKSAFQINPLIDNQLNKEFVLNDKYDLAYKSEDIVYIDFDDGYYFVDTESGLKRLEIESGEPLYNGAEDKVLENADAGFYDDFFPATDDSFYCLSGDEIYLISNDLELIDSTTYNHYKDGTSEYGPFYIGDNQFLMMETYEYQRKEHLKTSIAECVVNKSDKADSDNREQKKNKKAKAEEGMTYKNDEYGFSLTLPASWEGKYTVDEYYFDPVSERNINFHFVFDGEVVCNIFSINVLDGSEEEIGDPGPMTIIASKNGKTFAYTKMMEIPLEFFEDKELSKVQDEYEKMVNEDVSKIVETFSLQ